jgi:hypothetical protein
MKFGRHSRHGSGLQQGRSALARMASGHSRTRSTLCETESGSTGSKVRSTKEEAAALATATAASVSGRLAAAAACGDAHALAEVLLRAVVDGLELAPEEPGPIGSHAVDVLMRVKQDAAAARAEDGGLALEGRAQNDGEVGGVGASGAEDAGAGAAAACGGSSGCGGRCCCCCSCRCCCRSCRRGPSSRSASYVF